MSERSTRSTPAVGCADPGRLDRSKFSPWEPPQPARTRRSTFRIDRSKGGFPLGASNGGAERRARRRMSLALYLSRVRSSYLLDDMPALLDLIAWRILTLPSRAVAQRVFYRCEPLTVHTHIPGLCEEQNAPRISWTEAL